MDELMWLRMYGFGSSIDLTAILAFIAFGIVSFLAPVIGYRPERSLGVTASLFLLIGYAGVAVIQLVVQWSQLLDKASSGSSRRDEMTLHILLGFTLLKLILFLAAMLAFALGLRSFRVHRPGQDA